MFNSPEGELESLFIDDYAVIDQYSKTGTLWCWGDNTNGQLGTNDTVHRSSPVQTIVGGNNWKLVVSGNKHIQAIKTDNTLWAWGSNSYGQLGISTVIYRSTPTQITGTNWRLVQCGAYSTFAIKTDNTLYSWGANFYGMLGTSNETHRSSPVQVGTDSNWKSITSGTHHAVAIKTDSSVWVWGYNFYLGTNNTEDKSSPVQLSGTDWKLVNCGSYHTFAIKDNNTLWAWGSNIDGVLGVGDTVFRSTPTPVGIDDDWNFVASGRDHTAAIKTNGSLWMWGRNNTGALGVNHTISRSSPVQTLGSGANWKIINKLDFSVNNGFTAAVKVDGSLWTWGYNGSGQLGLGYDSNYIVTVPSPVQILADNNLEWKLVSCGDRHCVAITFDNGYFPIYLIGSNTSTSGSTITLPNGLIENDLIIHIQKSNGTTLYNPSGYTSLSALTGSTRISYKFMGVTPDTTAPRTGSIDVCTMVIAFRYVNLSSPSDATTVTNTGTSDPSAITTVSNNSAILAIGCTHSGGAFSAGPADYNFINKVDISNESSIFAVYKNTLTPGVYNPGAFTGAGDEMVTATIALKAK